jgi:hypothetical protein
MTTALGYTPSLRPSASAAAGSESPGSCGVQGFGAVCAVGDEDHPPHHPSASRSGPGQNVTSSQKSRIGCELRI